MIGNTRKTRVFILLVLLGAMFTAGIVPVHAPSNPTFVTYGDNATCGAHCIFLSVPSETIASDQWGVWGISPALVVTSGDLLVFMSSNFCISGTATSCDITAASDCLGNVFTATTAGNGIVDPPAGNPEVGMSILYSVATHSGTECATNAFTITITCAGCTLFDQWDTEWLVYEYANAVRVSNVNFVHANGASVTTLNGAITTNNANDAIMGCAVGATNIRPLTYGSSQTNQQAWAGNSGYPCGDLENLSVAAHSFVIGSSAPPGAGDWYALVTGEVTNAAPPAPPPSGFSQGVNEASVFVGIAFILVIVAAIKTYRRKEPSSDLLLDAGIGLGVLFVILQAIGALIH